MVLIGILGSIYYAPYIGILALAGLFWLEWRRSRQRKQVRPLVVYPAIRFSWIVALAVVGFLGLILWEFFAAETLGMVLAILAFIIWLLVSLRVFRYQRGRAKVKAMSKKKVVRKKRAKKKAVKKKAKRKPAKKKSKKKKAKKKKRKR